MTGMPKAGAIENLLGDRVGDDSAGASGGDIGDRVADGGERRFRAGLVRLAGLRRRDVASANNGQSAGERGDRLFRGDVGEIDVQSEDLCAPCDEVAVAEQVECRELQFIAAQPCLDGDVGPDACGFAQGQRERLYHGVSDIRSSRLCGLPAGTISTSPHISGQTSCRGFLSSSANRWWLAFLRTAPPFTRSAWSLP